MSTTNAELWTRATAVMPGGVNSNTRLLNPKIVIQRGAGGRIWDVDGNEYIDLLLGQGPAFLGHAHPLVHDAVTKATRDGVVFAATHPTEIEAAERLCDSLAWPEMVRIGQSSTEMIQAALRLARAATNRRRIVTFSGHYHGWLDNIHASVADGRPVPVSAGQSARSLDDLLTLPWNDARSIAGAFATLGSEIAGVLMEPMMINAGVITPRPGYLELVRELCDRYAAALIFDETISGFRIARGGAAEHFGVTPDLAVYGKAMAAGWPASALAGRASIMELFRDGAVGHFGTFNGNVAASAAIVAGLGIIESDPPYEAMDERGRRLMHGMKELAATHDVPLHVQGLPMAFHASMPGRSTAIETFDELATTDHCRYEQFCELLLAEGVWVARRGVWYLSAAHLDAEIHAVLESADRAFAQMSPALAKVAEG